MNNITAADAVALIEGTRSQGTVFGVTFVKRTNGEVRDMNARLAVSKGVTGKGMSYDPKSKNLIACCDMQAIHKFNAAQKVTGLEPDDVLAVRKSYRMIDADSMIELRLGGTKYTILPRA